MKIVEDTENTKSRSPLMREGEIITHRVIADDGSHIASGTSPADAAAMAAVSLVNNDPQVIRARTHYEAMRQDRINDIGRQLLVDWLNEHPE